MSQPARTRVQPARWRIEPAAHARGGSFDLAAYWRTLVKHRWIILAAVVGAFALGAIVTLLTLPTYTAQTMLQIDREPEKVVNVNEVTPADNLGEEFFQTQYGLLRSRALAARVADTTGLAQSDAFIEAMTARPRPLAVRVAGRLGLSHARPAASPATARPPRGAGPMQDAAERRTEVIDLLRANEGVIPERGSRLVAISFTSPIPQLSARVANAFAENFIASAIDRRFESSSYARGFLEQRLAQVKAKLESSERDLVAYAVQQQIIQLAGNGQPNDPEAGQSLAGADLEAYNNALAVARTDRIRAEQTWRQAEGASGMGLADILRSPTIQELSAEHAKLAADYQDKLSVFKPDYPDMLQLKARIDETNRQLKLEASKIRESLRAQYVAALDNESALAARVNGSKSAVLNLRGRSIQYNILQREADTNRTLYDGLLQRYKEVGVAGGVSSNNISIVDRAEVPTAPSHPRPLMNLLLAGFGGIFLGVASAFVLEALDQAIRMPSDVEDRLALPMLGTIPTLTKGVEPKEALADSRSSLSEAYQSLRSSLQFSTAGGFPKSLLVTSPGPGSGKSTTSYAVAQFVARLGFRVLLVDADLRDPTQHTLLGIPNRIGLTNLLTGAVIWKEAIQHTTVRNLFVVTSGPPPPNPAELLGGARLRYGHLRWPADYVSGGRADDRSGHGGMLAGDPGQPNHQIAIGGGPAAHVSGRRPRSRRGVDAVRTGPDRPWIRLRLQLRPRHWRKPSGRRERSARVFRLGCARQAHGLAVIVLATLAHGQGPAAGSSLPTVTVRSNPCAAPRRSRRPAPNPRRRSSSPTHPAAPRASAAATLRGCARSGSCQAR